MKNIPLCIIVSLVLNLISDCKDETKFYSKNKFRNKC